MAVARWAQALLSVSFLIAAGASDVWEPTIVNCAIETAEARINGQICRCLSTNTTDLTIQGAASKYILDALAADQRNGTAVTPLRIAGLKVSALAPLIDSVDRIAKANGLPAIQWTTVDPTAESFIKQDIIAGSSFHAYLLTGQQTGDLMAFGVPQDLSSLVRSDSLVEWSSLLPYYRSSVALFGGRVMSIPISGFMSLLYYRVDLFKTAQLEPPRTWDEAIQVAKYFNGTDLDGDGQQNDFGICMWQPKGCPSIGLPVMAILASLVQVGGYSSGLYAHPLTGKSVLYTAAWGRALELAAALSDYAPSAVHIDLAGSIDCTYMPLFRRGRCAMAIAGPNQFKIDSIARAVGISTAAATAAAATSNVRNNSSLHANGGADAASAPAEAKEFSIVGQIGAAQLPGSPDVLDWQSDTMVPCNPDRCPYAVPYHNATMVVADGLSDRGLLYVNVAPYASFLGFTAFVNKKYSAEEQLATYYLLSQAVSPENSWGLVASPSHGGGPTRMEHLQLANRRRWQEYGYNSSDLERFLAATIASLSCSNIAADVRSMGATNFSRVVVLAALNLGVLHVSVADTLNATRSSYGGIFTCSNEAELLKSYLASISYVEPETPPPPVPTYTGRHGVEGARSKVLEAALVSSLVGAAVLGAALVAMLGLLRRHRVRWLRRFGRILPPGPGRETTLCITDIQDSTLLWERLDEELMDIALRLHNACLRRCATGFGGYESATEGDSFILAFPKAQSALLFCLSAQEELMQLDWPENLLQQESCQPVWVWDAVRTAACCSHPGSREVSRGPKGMRLLQRIASSSQRLKTNVSFATRKVVQASPPHEFASGPQSTSPQGFREGCGGASGQRAAGSGPWTLSTGWQAIPSPGSGLLRNISDSEVDISDQELGIARGGPSGSLAAEREAGHETRQITAGISSTTTSGGRIWFGSVVPRSFMVRQQTSAVRSGTGPATTATAATGPTTPDVAAAATAAGVCRYRPSSEPCVVPTEFQNIYPAAAPSPSAAVPPNIALPTLLPPKPATVASGSMTGAALTPHQTGGASTNGTSSHRNRLNSPPSYMLPSKKAAAPVVAVVEDLLRTLGAYSTGGGGGDGSHRGSSRVCVDAGGDSGGNATTIKRTQTLKLRRQEPQSIWQLMCHQSGAPLRFALNTDAAGAAGDASAIGLNAVATVAATATATASGVQTSEVTSAISRSNLASAEAAGAPSPVPEQGVEASIDVFGAPGTGSTVNLRQLPTGAHFLAPTATTLVDQAFAGSAGPVSGQGFSGGGLSCVGLDIAPNTILGTVHDQGPDTDRRSEIEDIRAGRDDSQAEAPLRKRLVFRGLRVRMGCASGVDQSIELGYNTHMMRVTYTGRPIAIVRAIGAAAAGGMVLLSETSHALVTAATHQQYDKDSPRSLLSRAPQCVQLGDASHKVYASRRHIGDIHRDAHGTGGSFLSTTEVGLGSSQVAVFWYGGCVQLDESLPAMEVYQAATPSQALRWALLPPPTTRLKLDPLSGGIQAAFVGSLAVAVVAVSAASAIASIDAAQGQGPGDVWREAGLTIWLEAARLCRAGGGFLATRRSAAIGLDLEAITRGASDGIGASRSRSAHLLVTAAFPDATAAVVWASELITSCLLASWSPQLLNSEYGEALWAEPVPSLTGAATQQPLPAMPAPSISFDGLLTSMATKLTSFSLGDGGGGVRGGGGGGGSVWRDRSTETGAGGGGGGCSGGSSSPSFAPYVQPVHEATGSSKMISGYNSPSCRTPPSNSGVLPLPPSLGRPHPFSTGGAISAGRFIENWGLSAATMASTQHSKHAINGGLHTSYSYNHPQHRSAATSTPYAQWLELYRGFEPVDVVVPWSNLPLSRLRQVTTPVGLHSSPVTAHEPVVTTAQAPSASRALVDLYPSGGVMSTSNVTSIVTGGRSVRRPIHAGQTIRSLPTLPGTGGFIGATDDTAEGVGGPTYGSGGDSGRGCYGGRRGGRRLLQSQPKVLDARQNSIPLLLQRSQQHQQEAPEWEARALARAGLLWSLPEGFQADGDRAAASRRPLRADMLASLDLPRELREAVLAEDEAISLLEGQDTTSMESGPDPQSMLNDTRDEQALEAVTMIAEEITAAGELEEARSRVTSRCRTDVGDVGFGMTPAMPMDELVRELSTCHLSGDSGPHSAAVRSGQMKSLETTGPLTNTATLHWAAASALGTDYATSVSAAAAACISHGTAALSTSPTASYLRHQGREPQEESSPRRLSRPPPVITAEGPGDGTAVTAQPASIGSATSIFQREYQPQQQRAEVAAVGISGIGSLFSGAPCPASKASFTSTRVRALVSQARAELPPVVSSAAPRPSAHSEIGFDSGVGSGSAVERLGDKVGAATGINPSAAAAVLAARLARLRAANCSQDASLDGISFSELPPQVLQALVCRGPRIRAGVELGTLSLEVNGVTGAPKYDGPAVSSATALALSSPVSRVHVSSAVAAALHSKVGINSFIGVSASEAEAEATATEATTGVAEIAKASALGTAASSGASGETGIEVGGTGGAAAVRQILSRPVSRGGSGWSMFRPGMSLHSQGQASDQDNEFAFTSPASYGTSVSIAAWPPSVSPLITRVVVRAPANGTTESHSHGASGIKRVIFVGGNRH